MLHEPYIRKVENAQIAVLMIHGIVGSPSHFKDLLPLIPENWSVYNILLPGHGGEVEDFSKSSMTAWKACAQEHFDDLCSQHEKVVLIGHSMGTLFSIQMALQRPEMVAFLMLIDVPLRLGIKLFGVRNLIRFAFGTLDLSDPVQEATSRICSIPPTMRIWRYLGWIPRMVELLRQMYLTAKLISDLQIPAIAFQSKHDELVSARSDRILLDSSNVETHVLECSTHFYYHHNDVETVRTALDKLCQDWNRTP